MEVPEEEKKREKLIEELFQTEETYLDNLKLVYEVGRKCNFTKKNSDAVTSDMYPLFDFSFSPLILLMTS